MPYNAFRHCLNNEIGYGFTIALEWQDRAVLYFDCFMAVETELLAGGSHKPIYLLKEFQPRLAEYYEEQKDDQVDVLAWQTDDVGKAQAILTGEIQWTGRAEIRVESRNLYFPSEEYAREYGKLMRRIYKLAAKILPYYQG